MTDLAHPATVTGDDAATSSGTNGILEIIRNRRSIGRMTEEVPDRALIEQLIETAVWAPNHHLTQPWRFFVLSGDGRNALGRAIGEHEANGHDDPVRAETARASGARKPLRAPYVIAVASEPIHDGHTPDIEEHAATAAAAQNILLAAEALGLAAMWRSGAAAFAPEVYRLFGLSEHAQIIGFIYVGYPAMEKPSRERKPADEVTQWWDTDPAAR
jgi:nitroreductase